MRPAPGVPGDTGAQVAVRSVWKLDADAIAYAESHPHASFGHTEAWRRATARTYLLPSLHAVARRGGDIVGVAPWQVMYGPVGGLYQTIAPFTSYGGVLADDADAAAALHDHGRTQAARFGLSRASFRYVEGFSPLPGPHDRVREARFVAPRVDLSGGADSLFARLAPKARQFVRKARKLGVSVVEPGGLHDFDRIMQLGARALGSPFHGLRFFEQIRESLGPDCVFRVAYYEGQPAAAALGVVFRDTMHYVYGQNVHDLRQSCANTLVLWDMMEQASRRALSWFDLGRSEPDSSQARFKRQWNPEERPVTEVVLSPGGRSVPDLVPTNPRYALAQRLWRRMPLAVTRRAGPMLIRGIA